MSGFFFGFVVRFFSRFSRFLVLLLLAGLVVFGFFGARKAVVGKAAVHGPIRLVGAVVVVPSASLHHAAEVAVPAPLKVWRVRVGVDRVGTAHRGGPSVAVGNGVHHDVRLAGGWPVGA